MPDFEFVSTAVWLTAVITPPANVMYPAMVTNAAGTATGAANIAPPTAANVNPMVRKVLKNLGVFTELCLSLFFRRMNLYLPYRNLSVI